MYVKQCPFLPIPDLSITVLALTSSLSQTHTVTHSQMLAHTPVSFSPYFASSGETLGAGSGSSVEPLAREDICLSNSGLWGQACFLQAQGGQTPFWRSSHLCLPWGPMSREAECWIGSPLTPAGQAHCYLGVPEESRLKAIVWGKRFSRKDLGSGLSFATSWPWGLGSGCPSLRILLCNRVVVRINCVPGANRSWE